MGNNLVQLLDFCSTATLTNKCQGFFHIILAESTFTKARSVVVIYGSCSSIKQMFCFSSDTLPLPFTTEILQTHFLQWSESTGFS